MITRVTSTTMIADQKANLQLSMSKLSSEENASSSQQAITRPSDDPVGTATALQVTAEQAANVQYSRNVSDGTGWLSTADSALAHTVTLLQQARDLTLQGANDGAMSPSSKQAIATQLGSIRDSLLATANTTYMGRTVFAGSSDAGAAFDSSFNFTGTPGSSVQRRVSDSQTVQVDVDGSTVFGNGANSVFSDINSIISDLNSGVNIAPHLTQLDARLQSVSAAQSTVGTNENALTSATSALSSQKISLESQRSAVEDVDTAQSALDLQEANNVYEASLLVTSKTLSMNLTDFLH